MGGGSAQRIVGTVSKDNLCVPGLWFDLDVCYTGSFLMTLETKLNLARLGREGEGLREQGKEW